MVSIRYPEATLRAFQWSDKTAFGQGILSARLRHMGNLKNGGLALKGAARTAIRQRSLLTALRSACDYQEFDIADNLYEKFNQFYRPYDSEENSVLAYAAFTLGREDDAIQHVEDTLSDTNNPTRWHHCATTYITIQKYDEALACLKCAEQEATENLQCPSQWRDCALGYKRMNEHAKAITCLHNLEDSLTKLHPNKQPVFLKLAAFEWAALKQTKHAHRLLRSIEPLCQTPEQFISCSEVWRVLGHTAKVHHYLKSAEASSTTMTHWIRCGMGWLNNWQDFHAQTSQCLHTAEDLAETYQEYWGCAYAWQWTGEPVRAFQAQLQSESLAKLNDMARVAHNWLKLGDLHNMHSCLSIFQAQTHGDYIDLAKTWAEAGAHNQVYAAMTKAEEETLECIDLVHLGNAWLDFGYPQNAEHAYDRASAKVTDISEARACQNSWIHIGKPERATEFDHWVTSHNGMLKIAHCSAATQRHTLRLFSKYPVDPQDILAENDTCS